MHMGVKVAVHLGRGLRPLVDLVYPPRCPACGVAVAQQGGLCPECWSGVAFPEEPTQSIASTGAHHPHVRAATVYNDISRQLILNFKHGGKISLAKLLGQMMASRMPLISESFRPLLIPVPLHRTRLWQRGFNQAALLARELAKHKRGELLVDGLVRTKRTPSLGSLGKDERRAALSGAIRVSKTKGPRIKGNDIILVDDVLTSGATSDACVDALQAAGAKSTQIACFAAVVD